MLLIEGRNSFCLHWGLINVSLNPIIASLHASGTHKAITGYSHEKYPYDFLYLLFDCGCLIVFGNSFLLLFGADFTRALLSLSYFVCRPIV